jgi:hypothetical protein
MAGIRSGSGEPYHSAVAAEMSLGGFDDLAAKAFIKAA